MMTDDHTQFGGLDCGLHGGTVGIARFPGVDYQCIRVDSQQPQVENAVVVEAEDEAVSGAVAPAGLHRAQVGRL
jgi:hypothetical protein